MRIGELCAGYNGLGMAVEEVFNAEPAWFSEFDEAPSKILAHHYPNVPNHGDMTKIDWSAIEQVDIISGGTPCQDLSTAGPRRGMTEGTRSNLWVQMREAIAIQQPQYVVWENVRGAVSAEASSGVEQCAGCVGDTGDGRVFLRALGRVLGDLADLGFDAEWRGLRASDVGACHPRFRIFVLAKNTNSTARSERRIPASRQTQGGGAWPNAGRRSGTPTTDTNGSGGGEGDDRHLSDSQVSPRPATIPDEPDWGSDAWGIYGPAIRRWESVVGRQAPSPTELNAQGNHRLSPRFTEWMMGLPAGWVTDSNIGIGRNDMLKACGNGVVPQQAIAALRDMLAAFEQQQERTAA